MCINNDTNLTVSNRTAEDCTIYGHSLSHGFSIFIATYLIMISVGGITFNSILIHTIRKGRSLQNTSNTFIVNLSICDLIIAVSVVPFEADFLLWGHYNYGTIVCAIKEVAFMFSLPSSIVNLLLLTCERFVKILYPYRYGKIFMKKKNCLLLWVTWTYCGLVALFPIIYNPNAATVEGGTCYLIFPWHYITYQITINFFIPLFVILVMNLMIFRTAKRHALCIKKQKSSIYGRNTRYQKRKSLFPTNYKAAKTIMRLVGLFLMCWLTYIILVTHNVMCHGCHPREVTWIGNALNYSSITFNPILYGMHNKRIRKAVLRLFVKGSSEKQDREDSDRKITSRTFLKRVGYDCELTPWNGGELYDSGSDDIMNNK